jgi:DNA-binding NarL/FixJ family response regulator
MTKATVIAKATVQGHRPRGLPTRSIALIAGEGPRQAIMAILGRQPLAVTVFECVDSLLDDAESEPSIVVLWVEHTASSIPRLVEPLVQRFGCAPVVVVCPEIQRWDVRAALTAGAVGVVIERDIDDALTPCLQAVAAGQICVPRANSKQVEPPVLSWAT